MGAIIRMALAHLQLDVLQAQPAFTVPLSDEYLRELHACWRDTRALSHATSDGRTLAAMQDAAKFGLAHMPAVEPAIAALIVSPDEALRPDARCPRPQCRATDDLLSKAYDAAARMGRIGNSLSHLMLALSASLQEATLDASVHSFGDSSLQAFALMSRELGRLMSTLVQARRQVWLAQSPLTEACRRTLRSVPVSGDDTGCRCHEGLSITSARGRHPPPPSPLPGGLLLALRPVYAPLRQADGGCHRGPLRVAGTASPSEVAKQLPPGCQAALGQEAQSVKALPPCSGPMEGEIISPSGHAHGLHCIPSGDCHNRRIPLRVGCCVAEPDSSRPVACTGLLRVHQCAGATGIAQGTAGLSSVPDGEACASTVRQRLNCLSRKPPRGNQVCTAVAGVLGPPVVAGPPVSIRAMYLPGERNRPADFLSRCKPPPGEWRLHPEVVLNILDVFDGAEVDLFATEESTHCPHGSP